MKFSSEIFNENPRKMSTKFSTKFNINFQTEIYIKFMVYIYHSSISPFSHNLLRFRPIWPPPSVSWRVIFLHQLTKHHASHCAHIVCGSHHCK